jgi:predicted alpha-1,2-mannosidase
MSDLRRFAAVAVFLAGMLSAAHGNGALLDEVNTLQGTDSVGSFSHGNTLPLVGRPWGMTDWAPQTSGGQWYFTYQGKKIEGLRATRQPSPWMGDYGQFLLMPQTGKLAVTADGRASPYDVDAGIWKPDCLRLQLTRYNVTAELTATERCSVLRLTFHEGDAGRLIVTPPLKGKIEVQGRKILGFSQEPDHFGTFFVVELDRDAESVGTFENNKVYEGQPARSGRGVGAYVNFKTGDGAPGTPGRDVIVKVGTSFISHEQAERNLQREIGSLGFDEVRSQTAAAWEKQLGRIAVEGGTPQARKTFYTCLYRAMKYPHRIYELDAAGKPIHRSPYDGKLHDGVLYADNGFWDTFRCVYSFYSVAYPEQWKEIMQGWVQAYRENGWYPQWPSPGNRGCMIGTHIDAVIADAIVKNIDGLDLETTYAGLRKDATVNPREGDRGRQALDEYVKRGYVPDGRCEYAMSAGLDYAYDDWCVAQAARKLGKIDDYRLLMERAKNYRKSWDPSIGFMRGRKADGRWLEKFDEFAWGGPYVEGGPWQCSWAVQHDPAGLIELVGGAKAMVARLDKLLTMESTYHVGGYGGVIHEMREMAAVKFGQYDHGNQPGHHVLFLYTAAGEPWKTEYWTRKVCAELYDSGPQGFAGDEDNGEMASWYVLNALGFYPLTPGRPEYVLTSPLFTKAAIHLPAGREFVVTAPGNRNATVYVQKRVLNGRSYTNTWIAHEAIVRGGELQVELGEKPNERRIEAGELPYSMSTDAGK